MSGPEGESVADVGYSASLVPPYPYEVFILGEKGSKLVVESGRGSWVEAMHKAQDIKKALGIKKQNGEKS